MKKFLNGLLTLLLGIFIFILLFSFYGKMLFSSFITDFLRGVSTNIVDKNFVVDNKTKKDSKVKVERYLTLGEVVNSSEYKELLKDKGVQKILQKYIDSAIAGVVDPNSLEDVNLEEDLINYLIENKDELKRKYNIDISDEDIKKMQEDGTFKDIKENYIRSVETASASLSKFQKSLIKAYTFLCSTAFKILMIVLIIIDLILISILEGSLYKWINILGINLVTCGILNIILGIILHFSINGIIARLNLGLRFNMLKISLVGLIAAIIGGIFMVIYFVIKKMIEKNKSDDLYDEVSKGEDDYELSLDDI